MIASGSGLVTLGSLARRRRRLGHVWDDERERDDGRPHIRSGRVVRVMPDLGQGEEVIS